MSVFSEIKKGLYVYEEVDRGWVISINTAEDLLKAAEKVRDAKVKSFDCFTPYPIHGLDKAMGLHRSWVNFFSLIGGLFGCSYAFLGMSYIEVIDWPRIFGGKPAFSFPAFIPVTFEMTVLFASFSTVVAVFWLGRLGKIDRKPVAPRVTSDGFAVWIGDDMAKKDVEKLFGSLAAEIRPVTAGA